MVPALRRPKAVAQPPDARQATSEVASRLGSSPDQLIGILQEVQKRYGYLPRASLEQASSLLGIPISRVYQAATFFKAFSLDARGRRVISVCLGTACHVRQAPLILQALERKLGVEAGGTTRDREFTLLRVACLGACALGPVVEVGGKVHGHMTVRQAERLPAKLLKEAPRGDG